MRPLSALRVAPATTSSSSPSRLIAAALSCLLLFTQTVHGEQPPPAAAAGAANASPAQGAPPAAVTLPGGLVYEVTRPVQCTRKTKNGDRVSVHYRGTLKDGGKQFDSSYDRNDPFTFTLGHRQVIQGWEKGLLDMCIGEGRRLIIPPAMGYGDEDMGEIPPSSTLVFDTELMGIAGVKAENPPQPPPPDVGVPPPPPPPSSSEEEGKQGSASGPKGGHGEKGECSLLGPFALLIQGALGLLAVSSLVWKRYRESPRRPLKIWFFDASKQVFGSGMLHLANLFMSMLSSGKLDVAAKAPGGSDPDHELNPCSFYLLNLAIDTTIGIPILVLLLRLLHRAAAHTPLANPPESIKSGNYGQPPRASWWFKQSMLYFLGLFGMKLCVFFIFQLLPWIAWVGDWALRWTEGNEIVQITFVMLIFPLIMNALQYYIIDSFIKDPSSSHGGGHQPLPTDETDSDDSDSDDELGRRRTRGRQDGVVVADDDGTPIRQTTPRQRSVSSRRSTLKEANPTPVPAQKNSYDPRQDGIGSSSGSSTMTGRSRNFDEDKKTGL